MGKYEDKREDDDGSDKAKEITKAKFISGFAKESNLDKWASYASKNSYDGEDCKRQAKADLDSGKGFHDAENEWSKDWRVKQHDPSNDVGHAKIDSVTARNTFTKND